MSENKFQFYLKRDGWALTDEVGYCTGKKSSCPTCNSDKISIFFKPGFLGKENGKWCDYMDNNDFTLCNDYKIILKSNFNPNWVCKDCHDCGVISKDVLIKIKEIFSVLDKEFSQQSEPVFLDSNAQRISLKEIHNAESINNKPISLIAVTRHQYDTSNFVNYQNYIKNRLKLSRIYYGLWSDGKKAEWDVLYAIPTDDTKEVLNHLNAHDQMNDGISQSMALVIDSDGNYNIIENPILIQRKWF